MGYLRKLAYFLFGMTKSRLDLRYGLITLCCVTQVVLHDILVTPCSVTQ